VIPLRTPARTRPIGRARSRILLLQAHSHELAFPTAVGACEIGPEIAGDNPMAFFSICLRICAPHSIEDEDDVARVDVSLLVRVGTHAV
jgi:hypothetical protein